MSLTTQYDLMAIGRLVCFRRDFLTDVNEGNCLVEFSSYRTAELALKLLRTEGWLRSAELMLDDEDFLTIQVLHRRAEKRVASGKFAKSNLEFLQPQTETMGGLEVPSALDLGDLL